MKQISQFFVVFMLSLFAMSCGKFHDDGTSVWQGGLWIIPCVLILASLYSFYRAYKQWKSGSAWWGQDEKGVAKRMESKEKVNFFSIGATRFGIIFLLAFIVVVIVVNADK